MTLEGLLFKQSLFSKASIFGLLGDSAVKSVQRGTCTVTNGNTYTDITISAVDTARCSIKIFSTPTYAYALGAQLLNSTTIRLNYPTNSPTGTAYWEIVEYNPSIVKAVQRGITALLNGSAQEDATLSAININKSILWFSTNVYSTYIGAQILNTTTVRFYHGTVSNQNAYWEVTEFY